MKSKIFDELIEKKPFPTLNDIQHSFSLWKKYETTQQGETACIEPSDSVIPTEAEDQVKKGLKLTGAIEKKVNLESKERTSLHSIFERKCALCHKPGGMAEYVQLVDVHGNVLNTMKDKIVKALQTGDMGYMRFPELNEEEKRILLEITR